MKLPAATAALSGFTDVYKLTADDINRIGTGGTVQVSTHPIGGVVNSALVFRSKAHAGTSTDLVMDVGRDVSDYKEFIDAFAMTDAGTSAFSTGGQFTATDGQVVNGSLNNSSEDIPIYAKLTFTGTVTDGEYLVCFNISNPRLLAEV